MWRSLPLAALSLALAACQTPSLPVYSPGLTQPRFTRVNLRTPDGIFLRSSNILSHPDLVPAGSPVEISDSGFTDRYVNFTIHKVRYTMYPTGGTFDTSEQGVKRFVEKYFVDTREEIDLEKLGPPELVSSVRRGQVLRGMTKDQVYVALGPPQWIDDGLSSLELGRERILRSDRWVYTDSVLARLIPRKVAYLFQEGKLQEISR
ncbi:MAG: hypothetical protein O7J95_03945 [Planctomycetota bacterium]|nr:hypothetical protein [Planctomycetota bacterium]